MPTYPLSFPSIGITRSRFGLRRVVPESESPFTGNSQVYRFPFERWEGEVTFRPTRRVDAGIIQSFLAELRGKFGTFLYGDPDALQGGVLGTNQLAAASTNHIRNVAAEGAVVGVLGSGGALPTNWALNLAAGLTTEIVAVGVKPNGIPYIRVRISGTPTGVQYSLRFEQQGAINAAVGQTWTGSQYVALAGGTLTNITNAYTNVTERDASAVTLGGASTTFIPTADFGRYYTTRTFINALAARANMSVNLALTIGQAIDVTLDVGGCQLEQLSLPSPLILTSGSVLSRSAGVKVNGAGQYGNTLTVVGFEIGQANALKAGDYFQLGTGANARLYLCTQPAVSDVFGKSTLTFEPSLRSTPADAADVVLSSPKGVFRLIDNMVEWSSGNNGVYDPITIGFKEVINQ